MKNEVLSTYQQRIKRIVISEDEIKQKIAETGKTLTAIYDGRPILVIGVLKGSFMFIADLCRAIDAPCDIEFIRAKSYYSGTVSSGNVIITQDTYQDLSGYHVVLVEDIVDSGRTLLSVTEILKKRNPVSFTVVTLLDKPDRRVVDVKPDISLFTVPDFFAIGYGLDCAEYYRNLPYIAEYDQSI